MIFIYYNVSGEMMELLQLLVSFLTEQFKGQKIGTLIKLFADNSFSLKETLKNLKPETLGPIVKDLFSKTNTRAEESARANGLSPISNFADKEIIYSLNKYFAVRTD